MRSYYYYSYYYYCCCYYYYYYYYTSHQALHFNGTHFHMVLVHIWWLLSMHHIVDHKHDHIQHILTPYNLQPLVACPTVLRIVG